MGHSELNRKPGVHKQGDQQKRILGAVYAEAASFRQADYTPK